MSTLAMERTAPKNSKWDGRTVPEHFEALIDRDSAAPCWLWQGSRDPRGYGKFYFEGKQAHAHRFAYAYFKGEDVRPDDVVCHSCDNPQCVAPDHLWLGTQADNMQDCVAKGRHRACSLRGELNPNALLNTEQVLTIRTRDAEGERQCDLAAEYGVKRSVVNKIVRRKTWSHV